MLPTVAYSGWQTALLLIACAAGALADPPQSVTSVYVSTTTTTLIRVYPTRLGKILNVCTTTVTDWLNWRGAPTPAPGLRECDELISRGHELAYIPDSALAKQSLEAVRFSYRGWPGGDWENNVGWCCDTCLGTNGCALYQFDPQGGGTEGVCTHYIVRKGSGAKVPQYGCPNGYFELDYAPPMSHKPETETGRDWERYYAGGLFPGPCFSPGKLASWQCQDGAWGGLSVNSQHLQADVEEEL